MSFLKIVQGFLLPSAFVALFVIIGFILLQKKKKKWGKGLIIAGLLSYYLFSITPVSDFILMPLEEKYSTLKKEDIEKADKAVLLLGGRESNVLRGNEALRIWHLSGGEIELIISGADPRTTVPEEARALRNFFIHRGVEADDITIEGESRNTRENVLKIKEMVGEEPFFLVTSGYHMERSMREFRRIDANPIPAPTDFKRRRNAEYGFLDFVPDAQNLRNSDLAFHEHIGTFYYRLIFLLR